MRLQRAFASQAHSFSPETLTCAVVGGACEQAPPELLYTYEARGTLDSPLASTPSANEPPCMIIPHHRTLAVWRDWNCARSCSYLVVVVILATCGSQYTKAFTVLS